MAEYKAKSGSSLNFELTQGDQLIGKLIYKSWFKFNAGIELSDNISYQVEPKGFWGTTIELKDNEKVLLKFTMNWNGQIVINTYFDGTDKSYVFKHKGLFKESYILVDEDGTELMVMKPQMKWKNLSYEYDVSTSDEFEALTYHKILLMISLHCANYYISMMMGGTVPGAGV